MLDNVLTPWGGGNEDENKDADDDEDEDWELGADAEKQPLRCLLASHDACNIPRCTASVELFPPPPPVGHEQRGSLPTRMDVRSVPPLSSRPPRSSSLPMVCVAIVASTTGSTTSLASSLLFSRALETLRASSSFFTSPHREGSPGPLPPYRAKGPVLAYIVFTSCKEVGRRG